MGKPQRKATAPRRAPADVASNDNGRKGPGVAKVRTLLPTPLEQLATAIQARNTEKNLKKRAKLAAAVDQMKAEMTSRTLQKVKARK